ncbi:MAG TPA: GNAT family N-acetyltransferase [Puia sp.]|nr:GNAT family N-acetyltransferase [Puia sp.]
MLSNEEDNKEYRIERMSAQRLKDLEELYLAVYAARTAKDYFRKKYDTAYTGLEYTGYIALNKQDIAVAYYGVIPTFIKYNSEIILAAQSADTMTHPDYRYKGMFASLSNACFDLCRTSGIRFIFGFPNQNFYKAAVNKWGWKVSEVMECFIIPVQTLPLASLSLRMGWLKGLYRKYSRRILDKYTLPLQGLPNSAAWDGFGGVLRNEEYLKYKTYSASRVIRAGKAKAWISVSHALVIGDLALDGEDIAVTIKAIKKIAAKLGIRTLFFHTSPDTYLHTLFKTRYKGISSFPVIIQDLLDAGLAFDKIKFTFADIDIF